MNPIASVLERKEGSDNLPTSCRVSLFYQDGVTCRPLMLMERSINDKFKDEIDFDFGWWRFKFLRDDLLASVAAQSTANADLILFSVYAQSEIPTELIMFNEIWLKQRQPESQGLLTLIQCHNGIDDGAASAHQYFKEVALAANMDFIARRFFIGLSTESETTHPTRPTALSVPKLETLLRESRPPIHWGLNE